MANLELIDDEGVLEFLTNTIQEIDLDAFANFKWFWQDCQKQFVKVQKAGQATEFFSKTPDCVLVYINSKIWDRLEEKQRYLLIRNAINGITYDDEKGKMSVEQPDLGISSGCYAKFGAELVDAAEIAANALRQIKEEEKAKKEAAKAAKAEQKKKWTPNQE